MLKKLFLLGFTSLLSLNLVFCSAATTPDIEKVPIDLDEKIGQMMCLDFRFWDGNPVTEINDDIKEIIGKYHIGSVILFRENFKTKEQSKKLIKDLHNAATAAGNPRLLICVDQEGGLVERFSFNRKKLVNNMDIGKGKNAEKVAFEKGDVIGKELAELLIDCDLAPVVDINSNPKNPVIGVRSFGETQEIVSTCGISFMKGLHQNNIIATAKHFPGHGDTDVDSHLALPRINKTLEEFESMELKPFEAMINQGVDMIMTAHIELPKIETQTITSKKDGKGIFLPATLSKKILTGLLRDKLKFQGVIITDAMNMKAISENIGEAEAIKMAILAGANIICMPVELGSKSDVDKLDAILEFLKNAVKAGEIPEEQIINSAEHISALKNKLN